MITPVDPKMLDTPNRVKISPPPMRKMVVKFVRFPWYSRYQAFDTPMNIMTIPIISVTIFVSCGGWSGLLFSTITYLLF